MVKQNRFRLEDIVVDVLAHSDDVHLCPDRVYPYSSKRNSPIYKIPGPVIPCSARLTTPQMTRSEAELAALDLWDRLLAENDHPSQIEMAAGKARFFRRVQLVTEILRISERNARLELVN
jgi:hypothetical protein